MTDKTPPPGCKADVHRPGKQSYSGIKGSPIVRETGQCTRAGRVQLESAGGVGHFCRQHADMALSGYVGANGETPSPLDMANYRRYDMDKPHAGVWKEPDGQEEA